MTRAPDPDAEVRRLAGQATEQDPTGWFDRLYAAANEGAAVVPWDRGGPHPLLTQWTAGHMLDRHGRRAVVVGCGPGFDAEHLAALGFTTTAFDVSPAAVSAARERHAGSRVDYTTADLLDLPPAWAGAFDLVLESLTVQSLPVGLHPRAIRCVRSLVAPGGTLLVIAGAREDEHSDVENGPPWRLARSEIEAFAVDDLRVRNLELLTDSTDPALRRWRVELGRDSGARHSRAGSGDHRR